MSLWPRSTERNIEVRAARGLSEVRSEEGPKLIDTEPWPSSHASNARDDVGAPDALRSYPIVTACCAGAPMHDYEAPLMSAERAAANQL